MTNPNTSHPFLTGGNGMAVSAGHTAECAAMRDLAPGYALRALEPDEFETVDRHRAKCPTCAGDVATFERTVALLPFLAPRATPAPDIKAALFARIAQAGQVEQAAALPDLAASIDRPFLTTPLRASTVHAIPAPSPTIPASTAAAAGGSGQRGRSGGVGRWLPHTWRGYTTPIATTAIPLVLALALVGGWAYSLYDRAEEAQQDQERWSTVSSVLGREGGTVYQLTSAKEAAPQASGQLLASPDGTTGMLVVHGLTEYAGRSYEVWIELDGRMTPYATLELDSRGDGQMLIELDHSFKRCRGVYVQLVPTDDPAGTNSANVLWTTLTSPGPANSGDPTEGNPQIGSTGATLQRLSTK